MSVEAGGTGDVAHGQEDAGQVHSSDRIVVHDGASIVADGSAHGGRIDLNMTVSSHLAAKYLPIKIKGRVAVSSGGVLSLAGNVGAESAWAKVVKSSTVLTGGY